MCICNNNKLCKKTNRKFFLTRIRFRVSSVTTIRPKNKSNRLWHFERNRDNNQSFFSSFTLRESNTRRGIQKWRTNFSLVYFFYSNRNFGSIRRLGCSRSPTIDISKSKNLREPFKHSCTVQTSKRSFRPAKISVAFFNPILNKQFHVHHALLRFKDILSPQYAQRCLTLFTTINRQLKTLFCPSVRLTDCHLLIINCYILFKWINIKQSKFRLVI